MTATSRRTALCGTITGIIAGTFAVPGIAASSADARLIMLCDHLHALQDEFSELFARRMTIEQARTNGTPSWYAQRNKPRT